MAFFFYNNLTPAARMSPNREANTVANVTVKPSVVVVPTCETVKDNQSAQCECLAAHVFMACGVFGRGFASSASSRTVAWNPASKGKDESAAFVASLSDNVDTACGDGACDPHITATNSGKPRRATVADPLLFSYYDFGASAPDSRTKTKIAQQREVCVLTNETEGRVSGGDRAIQFVTNSLAVVSHSNRHERKRCAVRDSRRDGLCKEA